MAGFGGYCAKRNKSGRERQILYVLTYMWNLKNKTNKLNKTNRQGYREQTRGCQRVGGLGDGQNR